MAYRIAATTDRDRELLDAIKDEAWRQRIDLSQLVREAFLAKLYGAQKNWPEPWLIQSRLSQGTPPGRAKGNRPQ